MNFNIFWLMIILSTSCGLKTRPKPPADSNLPSIKDSYSTKYERTKAPTEQRKKKK